MPMINVKELISENIKKLDESPYRKKKIDKPISLIKKLSDLYNGDEEEFLTEYTNKVIDKWFNDLDKAIKCFERLVEKKNE